MATSYLETSDEKLSIQLTNFSSKISGPATSLGISGAEVTSIQNDAAYFSWAVVNLKKVETYKKQWTPFKSILKKSNGSTAPIIAPLALVLDPAPTAVAPGVVTRFSNMVTRIKSHPNYTKTIGENLGIEKIGSSALDPASRDAAKPVIKPIVRGGKVDLIWKKGKFTGIVIEKDSGSGYVVLDKDFKPNYTDPTPMPAQGQSALWKYRASYLVNDDKVGNWSDEVSITVTG